MRTPWIGFALLVIVFGPYTQGEGGLRIDSPVQDQVVGGTVEITGSADITGLVRYRVEFAYDPNPTGTWFLIAESATPIRDGILAVWETAAIHEGEYLLRLSAYLADGSLTAAEGTKIRISQRIPAIQIPPAEDGIPTPEGATAVSGRMGIIFPASTASRLPGKPTVQSGDTGFLATSLAGGAGFILLGLTIWLVGSRWLLWRRRERMRAERKNRSRNE